MILGLTLFALVLLAALWLVLQPLRGGMPTDPDAPERHRLTAERDRLYAELSHLTDESRRPDLERRAALILRALDALPAAPPPRERGRRTRAAALAGLAVAALVTVAGAVTFVPRWQLASLGADEVQDVRDVLALPGLRRKAETTGEGAAYLAWGRAAFDSARYAQAVTAYGNALKLDPRQPEALRRLGILLLTRGEQTGQTGAQPTPEDARQAFLLIRTAAQLAPKEPESQLLLGFALARFGQDADALTALERYRTLDPKGRDADDLITSLHARQNESDPGLRVYAANCASCHGPNGGGGLGPNLRVATLSREALENVIVNGKGAMPASPNLKPEELNALLDVLERWQKEGE
ncbi:cytochrome oxidase family protein containing TPR repeats [Deinococcus aerius]|uniref:Cytochrome oxidase family protein containing TPR repeats n=3 Tax=Deinococcus TaxID=1298 RepID=A0A2I9CSI2_9DEIO|nr:c-type cytochrome [Deinococcus metallilatus]GBF04609.1 cytochrome oxidase family protein containing TPR repeats [Deinococcus aerius]MBB5293931.1 mono/diheme cytochrome c family protein [Deinococcus metallilatus]QBY07133.1 tetratricopeptide repeat protein [Deinococcus metallilatus]RXJ14605.1 tetratricopeptide repeat protein [Deinococcus metallilatus]TLK30725.1 tetratricopeptide repeat protein [Deinococcus metallilatus]